MMTDTILYAKPYDFLAKGFYFKTVEQYKVNAERVVDGYGKPVEEFEIQLIDGERIDCALALAWGIDQTNFEAYLKAVETWDDDRKRRYIIAVGECGYSHDQVADDPNADMVEIYPFDSLRDLAESFVDEGLYGEIPESLRFYINHDAIAHDLAVEFTETDIAGERLVYACR